MTSVLCRPSQLKSRSNRAITVIDTAYLYPQVDIDAALAITTFSYKRVGNRVICPTIDDIVGIGYDIYAQTATKQPLGNQGYALGRGTFLNVFGDTFSFCLP
jgi:hypothetical protein